MTENRSPPERSIEDILGSIRRIIAEDDIPAMRAMPGNEEEPLLLTDRIDMDEGDIEAVDEPRDFVLDSPLPMERDKTPPADTLENLVREMLKPMLHEWLDQNLPGMVREAVDRKIQR